MDHAGQSTLLHDPDSVAQYRRYFDRLGFVALPPVDAILLRSAMTCEIRLA